MLSSKSLSPYVLRPAVGTAGKPTQVRSNFFEVTTLPSHDVQHLHLQILPERTPPAICRKIWQNFESSTQGQAFTNGTKVIFDGRANLFAPKPLKCGDGGSGVSFEVTFEGRATDKFKLLVRPVGSINMTELANYFNGIGGLTNNCLTAIMVLDVLIRQGPSLLYPTVGRSFFTQKGSFPLSNGAEVWQGYYQSARPTKGKMMINIDVSATAFYESGPLPEIVAKILNRNSVEDLRGRISDRDVKKLANVFKNVKIMVVHRGTDKQYKYKITNLTPSPASETMFTNNDGEQVSVASYFQSTYNRRLAAPFLPCVVVKKDVFLPMEVCQVIPGQRYLKKLNEKQTAEMIKFTCHKPNVRANKIQQGLPLLKHKDNEYIQAFGVTISPEMAITNARVLSAPKVSYHNTSQGAHFTPANGSWNLLGKKLASAATLNSWSVLNFARVNDPIIERFIRELVQKFVEVGMTVTTRNPPILSADPQGKIEKSMAQAYQMAGKRANCAPQLIVCIMPTMNGQLYAEIKRISETILGIPTQCLQSKKIAEAKKQYCANVCLKVNTKLGGYNHVLDRSAIPFISKSPTIIFGADVTHPGPGEVNRPSIAALTASMDANASRYISTTRVQSGRTEIIADLANMVKDMLIKFLQKTSCKPQQILFYRDGVSEGQFAQVLDYEVAAIHAACASLEKNYRPKVTFVVVQKRHHARFFPIHSRDAEKSGNCQPGTVVDTNIVHPFEFDFYLQSHAGLLGTSRPTHYHVLYDDNKFSADALQELTYRLCYLYGRCTKSVSLCPPVYYAHLVAARARCHRSLDNWEDSNATSESLDIDSQINSFAKVNSKLQDTMYFM